MLHTLVKRSLGSLSSRYGSPFMTIQQCPSGGSAIGSIPKTSETTNPERLRTKYRVIPRV
jgi:hypothetical protein